MTKKNEPEMGAIERVLITGDLARLTEAQRSDYYGAVCDSLGLNPLTQPFAYLALNGKTVLYATKAATEQLRSLHGVSISSVDGKTVEGVYLVTATGKDAKGRTDAATGAVPIAGLKGESLANALMKAETKAKRRLTLSLCGLGMLDESEVESIPGAVATPATTTHALPPAAQHREPEPEPRREPQPSPASGSWTTDRWPKDADVQEHCDVLEAVTSKSGEKNGKPWTRFGVKVGGMWLNTFDEVAAEVAGRLKGCAVTVEFITNDRGFHDLLSLSSAGSSSPVAAVDEEPLPF
jgi:hypothetical protein